MRLNVHGDTSGDTYALWEDAQWMAKKAAALSQERGRHELSLQHAKEAKREKRRQRWGMVRVLAHHVDRMVRDLEKLPGVKALVGAVGLGLAGWLLLVLL